VILDHMVGTGRMYLGVARLIPNFGLTGNFAFLANPTYTFHHSLQRRVSEWIMMTYTKRLNSYATNAG
jgi:hypothetical protein